MHRPGAKATSTGGRAAAAASIFTVTALCLCVGSLTAEEGESYSSTVTARELLSRTYENLYSVDSVQDLTISSYFPGGRSIRYRMRILSSNSQPLAKSLIRFMGPNEVQDTSILVLERDDRSDDIFVYLPAFQITRRVGAFQRGDAFFGTDLAYEDLEVKKLVNYTVRFVGSDGVGSARCLEIEAIPLPHLESSYERTVNCIDPERDLALWVDFYQGGSRVKRLEVDLAHVRKVGDRLIPHRVKMVTHATGSETELAVESYVPHAGLPERYFTTLALQQRLPRFRQLLVSGPAAAQTD